MLRLKHCSSVPALLLAVFTFIGVLPTDSWARPGYKILHGFTGSSDGGGLYGSLFLDQAGNLYGTTLGGGMYLSGTVFELSRSSDGGWAETILYNFCAKPRCTDGSSPNGDLVFDQAGNLYGTTSTGGPSDRGEIFGLAHGSGGWSLSVLHDGDALGLVLDAAGDLYGYGGPGQYNAGDIFELSPGSGGWTYNVLFSFDNKDGSGVLSPLIFDGHGNLYGTTEYGGSNGGGIGFKLKPPSPRGAQNDWQEQILHNFQAFQGDGLSPRAGLVFDHSGNLYGATAEGGAANHKCTAGCGTVFELTPRAHSGWKETILHEFPKLWDGAAPLGTLAFDEAGNLYGTTVGGGKGQNLCNGGCGVVFKMTPGSNGKWKYTVLHRFAGPDGAGPWAALTVDHNGNLYGTTQFGGPGYYGVVFEITP